MLVHLYNWHPQGYYMCLQDRGDTGAEESDPYIFQQGRGNYYPHQSNSDAVL